MKQCDVVECTEPKHVEVFGESEIVFRFCLRHVQYWEVIRPDDPVEAEKAIERFTRGDSIIEGETVNDPIKPKESRKPKEEAEPPKGATKLDGGKPPLTLVPRELLEGAARAFAFGAKKYGRFNYRSGKGLELSRLLDSLQRHVIAWADGEETDPESGLSHLDHAAASLGMLMDTKSRVEKGALPASTDDRWKEK